MSNIYKAIANDLKPRRVILTRAKGFISAAICKCQDIYTQKKYNKPSLFSHIVLIGEDGICYESTVEFNWKKFKLVYGMKASDPKKTYSLKKLKDYEVICFQKRFDVLKKKQWTQITEYAKKCVRDKVKYGGLELFGTLWTLIKWRFYLAVGMNKSADKLLEKKNPFDDTENVYCIAFVSDAIASTGKKYIKINSSVATVDEGYYNCNLNHKTILNEIG